MDLQAYTGLLMLYFFDAYIIFVKLVCENGANKLQKGFTLLLKVLKQIKPKSNIAFNLSLFVFSAMNHS